MPSLNASFWNERRVLLTGHTGFKGGWLAIWLKRLKSKVTGLALTPAASPNLYSLAAVKDSIEQDYICDIRSLESVRAIVESSQPEIIIHLAAQPLVRSSYLYPLETISTNIIGTSNLLEIIRNVRSVRVAIMVTTDKVYAPINHPRPYVESDSLGGHDPYSASKAASEMVIDAYRKSFLADCGVALGTARAGNVIGGGDWAENRLLPDAIRSWSKGSALTVRHPSASRPWQHVLEPLYGYLRLAECLWSSPELSTAYNFGPQDNKPVTVEEVIRLAQQAWPGKTEVLWGEKGNAFYESEWLGLEVSRAKKDLGVVGRWSTTEAVGRTVNWYHNFLNGYSPKDLCLNDIENYESLV